MTTILNIGPASPGQHCLPRGEAGCCSFTIGLSYDFGARNYLPALPRWSSMDPLAEKYYSVSPYVYCAGNPVNLVDEDGLSTRVKRLPDGTYEVIGGNIKDGDSNIYVYTEDENGRYMPTGETIGITTSLTSFYDSDLINTDGSKGAWVRSIINLDDNSGKAFLDYVVDSKLSLLGYAINAIPKGIFDFKRTNGTFSVIYTSSRGFYRGMPVGKTSKGTRIISSARDVGNMAAGFEAGLYGIPWSIVRIPFDILQIIDSKHIKREGDSSQNAQKLGWSSGFEKYKKYY